MNKLIAIFSSLLSFLIPPSVYAQDAINLGNKQTVGIQAVGNANSSVGSLVASGLQIIYIFAGLAVLAFFVWGAFDWITAGGDKEKIAAARRKIVNSIIGLFLLAISAFAVALFGDIVGINPFNMGEIPQLGQQVQPRQQPTTP